MTDFAPSPPEASRNPDMPQLCLLLGLCLTALIYLDTLGFQFVYDDLTLIVRNPQVQSWHNLPSFFSRHLWASYAATGSYYRPMYQIWLLLNYSAFGLNPLLWHAAAVAAHLAATFMVYLLLARLSGQRLAAALAATLFGVHPVHIEGVAWVSGAIEPVMTLFFLGSFLCHLKARERSQWWWGASVALYGLAVLTKEAAAAMPALVLAYEWIDQQAAAGPSRWRRLASATLRSLPYAAVALLYLAARFHWQVGLGQSEGQNPRALWLTAPAVLAVYWKHLLWPFGLSIFYHLPLVQHLGFRNFLAPVLLLAGTALAAIWISLRSRPAAFAVAWIGLTMIPPIAGLPLFPKDEIAHDRYLYLPSVGFALLLALAIARWLPLTSPRRTRISLVATAALALALAAATLFQTLYWANNLLLFTRGIEIAPLNVNANNQLANEFFKRGRGDRSLQLYRRSLQLDPDNWATTFSLAITEFDLGQFTESQLHLQRAIQLSDANPLQFYYLGLARIQLGQWQTAEQPLRRALELAPGIPGLHYAMGVVLAHQGSLPAAREQFEAELKVDPNSAAARQGVADLEKRLSAR